MRSLAWNGAWLGLAVTLVMGGCPGGVVSQKGIVQGTYIGTLNCALTGQLLDGTPIAPQSFPLGMSVEMAEDGSLYLGSAEYYVGAVVYTPAVDHSMTETITGVSVNDDSILIGGTVVVSQTTGALTGSETILIEQNGSDAVNMTHQMQTSAADIGLFMTQTCGGTLTR